jgi:endonuclease/exonuclease/phosphatase family metal-dependent hydrolase
MVTDTYECSPSTPRTSKAIPDRPTINTELRRNDPDLVAFQEVAAGPERGQLHELLAETGLHSTHQADAMSYTPPFTDRHGGTAVATRWLHTKVEVLDAGVFVFIGSTAARSLGAEAVREQQAVALTTAWSSMSSRVQIPPRHRA